MQAVIREGDDSTAEKRRRAIKRYATAALEEQQSSVEIQDMATEEFEASKVACEWIGFLLFFQKIFSIISPKIVSRSVIRLSLNTSDQLFQSRTALHSTVHLRSVAHGYVQM